MNSDLSYYKVYEHMSPLFTVYVCVCSWVWRAVSAISSEALGSLMIALPKHLLTHVTGPLCRWCCCGVVRNVTKTTGLSDHTDDTSYHRFHCWCVCVLSVWFRYPTWHIEWFELPYHRWRLLSMFVCLYSFLCTAGNDDCFVADTICIHWRYFFTSSEPSTVCVTYVGLMDVKA